MKNLILVAAIATLTFTACSNGDGVANKTKDMAKDGATKVKQVAQNIEKNPDWIYRGEVINAENTVSMNEAAKTTLDKGEFKGKVKGTVESVCMVKGCWMMVQRDNGELVRTSFKDYGFFVPMDIQGKEVVMDGIATVDTTSVEDLRHYAEDEGLSIEEINKITEPEISVAFKADGVIIL